MIFRNTSVSNCSLLLVSLVISPKTSWYAVASTESFPASRPLALPNANSSAINSLRYRDICAYDNIYATDFEHADENSISRDSVSNNESSKNMRQWPEASHVEIRRCWACKDEPVFQGVASDAEDGNWVAFYCKHCVPRLSVRRNAQVLGFVSLPSCG